MLCRGGQPLQGPLKPGQTLEFFGRHAYMGFEPAPQLPPGNMEAPLYLADGRQGVERSMQYRVPDQGIIFFVFYQSLYKKAAVTCALCICWPPLAAHR
jgi:hypothetical protein